MSLLFWYIFSVTPLVKLLNSLTCACTNNTLALLLTQLQPELVQKMKGGEGEARGYIYLEWYFLVSLSFEE